MHQKPNFSNLYLLCGARQGNCQSKNQPSQDKVSKIFFLLGGAVFLGGGIGIVGEDK